MHNLGFQQTYQPRGYHTKLRRCGRCGSEWLEADLVTQDRLLVCPRCVDRHVLSQHPKEHDKQTFDDMPGTVFP